MKTVGCIIGVLCLILGFYYFIRGLLFLEEVRSFLGLMISTVGIALVFSCDDKTKDKEVKKGTKIRD